MLTISETLTAQADAAATKAKAMRSPGRLLISGTLAGAYIGIGVILMVSAAGPLLAAGDGFAKLISGIVFSAALTIVVFAGSELATSAMMILPLGALAGRVSVRRASTLFAYIFAANLLGSLLLALLVEGSGVLVSNAEAGSMISGMVKTKSELTIVQMVTRGILCNVLVCLAIWMGSRVQSAGVKIVLIFVAITAFVTSGFEHVVANMTTYWLGIMGGLPGATYHNFAVNLLWVGIGNVLGGGIVALSYWVIGRPDASSFFGRATKRRTGTSATTRPLAARAGRATASKLRLARLRW